VKFEKISTFADGDVSYIINIGYFTITDALYSTRNNEIHVAWNIATN